MKGFARFVSVLPADDAGIRRSPRPAGLAVVIAGAMISMAAQAQGTAGTRPGEPELEAQVARLKAETAALVAAAQPGLDALSPPQRLSAPPVVWRVPGALAEFK